MARKHYPGRRFVRALLGVRGAAFLAALAFAGITGGTLAFANAGDPDSTSSSYVVNSDGSVTVTVNGTWSWGDNSVNGGGKDSQSCWNGNKPAQGVDGHQDVNGHYAIGIAVSWNDGSNTPVTLTGKAVDGTPVTLHLPSTMDTTLADYCAGTTASAPYPHGTFSAQHTYANLAAFQAATKDTNGQFCANAYDVHQPNDPNESDTSQNGDNTLKNGHYALNVDCSTPTNATPSSPAPSTPAPSTPPPAAPTPAAAPAPAPAPSLALVKLERDDATGGTFVPGPIDTQVGHRVDYEIHLMNNGNIALLAHLVDPGCVIVGGHTLDISNIALSPGQTLLYHCSHVMTSDNTPTYTNTASASGLSASASASASAQPVSASAIANVAPAPKVLGAKHTVVRRVIVKRVIVRVVHVKAKPAPKVVKAATFTG